MLIASALNDFGVLIDSPVSAPYIELTIECLRAFGCHIEIDNRGYYRTKGRLCAPSRYSFQPDMSYAANFIAADMLCGGNGAVKLKGLEHVKSQRDAKAADLFNMSVLSIQDTPDLFPILCVYALKKDHITVIHGTSRLADKESNRIFSTNSLIESLGGRMEIFENSVAVHGCGKPFRGCVVDSFGDHRIVMAAAAASVVCDKPLIIMGAEAVSKSAPSFFDDFRVLGGKADEFVR